MACLREELEDSKAASAKLQIEHACREQAWQKDMLNSQAEHDKQVSKHCVLHTYSRRNSPAHCSWQGHLKSYSMWVRLVSRYVCTD